jgi:hypothetical protein
MDGVIDPAQEKQIQRKQRVAMTKPSDRKRISETARPVGHFAVMRHSHSGAKNMHCSCLHDTLAAAEQEAQRLCAEVIAADGPVDVCYYVLEIQRRYGIVDGRICNGA